MLMIAAGLRQGARVRTLSARRAAALAAAAGLVLLGAGAAIGYWAGTLAPPPVAAAAADGAPPAAHAFTLDQIGALSARLFTLESQAARLGERLGLRPTAAPGAEAERRTAGDAGRSEPRAAPPEAQTVTGGGAPPAGLGSGGPLLAPRPVAGLDDLGALDEQLARLEAHIDLVADAAAVRHADLMRMPSRPPVAEAPLVSPFGNRRDPFSSRLAFHAGLDFAAPEGTPILSAGGGTVVVAGWRPDYGWTVEIEHGNGLRTRYAHASRLLVERGAVVRPGERIALVGSTGRSTGPHLHFEVLREGRHVDPRRYLAQR